MTPSAITHPRGGDTGFEDKEMIELGGGCKNQNPQKSLGLQTKPPKLPGAQFNPPKIPCRISET